MFCLPVFQVQPAWASYVAAGTTAVVVVIVQRRNAPASRLFLCCQVLSAGVRCSSSIPDLASAAGWACMSEE